MQDIESYEDLFRLVKAFYDTAKEDESLGPIFHQFVHNWDEHAKTVARFWEGVLFNSGGYRGNPMNLHQQVDETLGHNLEKDHFDKWVGIWHQTTDRLFTGKNAELVKQRAANIANIMFIKIYQARN